MHLLNAEIIKPGSAGIAWFGQNSFALKDSSGTVILVDPFFPEKRNPDTFLYGNVPDYIFSLQPDIILFTHDHSDHTDIGTAQRYYENCRETWFAGPEESIQHLSEHGITGNTIVRINPGSSVDIKSVTIHGLFSKHPEGTVKKNSQGNEILIPAPQITHLGYVIKTADGISIYVSGDCQRDIADRRDLWEPIKALAPDIGLLTTHPSEGEFPFFEDTVKLSKNIGLHFAVPAHYECFTSRTYDPFEWQRVFPSYGTRPVIIPYNGFAVFEPGNTGVRYGYTAVKKSPSIFCEEAKAEKIIWSGRELYRLCNESWDALIDPEIGGNLIRLSQRQSGFEVLHRPVNYEAYAARPRIFGIPVILPPNRIKEGKFRANGKDYVMAINSPDGHHCHGFLSTEAWNMEEAGIANKCPFIKLSYINSRDCEFYKSFPHEFKVINTYTLEHDKIIQHISCRNLSPLPMPFGIGLHTAFNIPFDMSGRAGQVRLLLPVDKRWELDEVSIPTGYLAPLQSIEDNYRNGGVPADVQAIRDHYSGKALDTENGPLNGAVLRDSVSGAEIMYKAGKSFTHWMVWNDGGSSGYICPEPMTWAIDAPNSKLPHSISGYKELLPGESWEDELEIIVSRPEKEKEQQYGQC